MRVFWAVMLVLLSAQTIHAQGTGTEGGNITGTDMNHTQQTSYWTAIVGVLNGTWTDINYQVSSQDTPVPTVYYNEPNGSYVKYFNATMILTRLPFKPEVGQIFSPTPSDFNQSGMFSNFSVFSGVHFPSSIESPQNTFTNPWSTMTCYIYDIPFICTFITLAPDIRMGVLGFYNGTHVEPLFVEPIFNRPGYNGSLFDFEYIVPALENYFFYIYHAQDCDITVTIDGAHTTVFPKSGVPYDVRVTVRDNQSNPIPGTRVDAVEENGRSFLFPVLEIGRRMLGQGSNYTDSQGRSTFALSPTRYNIPDGYGYQIYVEVNENEFYCRKNLSIAEYGYLSPTYRSSLVDPNYESQVKASVQNMNALASTASRWIDQGKMRMIDVVVYTNGTHSALPTMKAGAPNMLNITVYNHTTLAPINASILILEENGSIIFMPLQPDKVIYDSARAFDSNQTPIAIPTRYNNNAHLSLAVGEGDMPFVVLTFDVDQTLENPTSGEADMDIATRSAIAGAQQNINSVLMNMGKSLSTV